MTAKHMKQMNTLQLFVAAACLAMANVANGQSYVINGTIYMATNPIESVKVGPGGLQTAESSYQYSGYVLVSGSGSWIYAADGNARNDLLYYFNNNDSGIPHLLPMFFGTAPINSVNATAIQPYDGNYPDYNPSHAYTFIVNIQVSTPSNLFFGVGDSYYPDNRGSLNVEITQLQPAPSAPVFITQPVSQVVSPGQAVTFTGLATGNPTPAYQWQFDGTNIDNETNASYSLQPTSIANIGLYNVLAFNPSGTNASATASLSFFNIQLFPGLILYGIAGTNYSIQAGSSLGGVTNWTTVTNITLTLAQPFVYIDYGSITNGLSFYRAVQN